MSLTWRLTYDRSFSRPGTWMVNALSSGIRARVPLGGDKVLDVELRWQRTHRDAPDAVYAYPGRLECWLTEPFEIETTRCQLELCGAPPHIDAVLRRL